MADYHKNGYLEAVLFLFYKDGKILIEYRPKGEEKEIFIPNGRIDTMDLTHAEDYKHAALKREIFEEFSGSVIVKKFVPLGSFIVEEIKIKFFGYLVEEWRGEVPEFTVEEGAKFADLKWIKIADYEQYLAFRSAKYFVKTALKIISEKENILNKSKQG